jgi:hypothetical protein
MAAQQTRRGGSNSTDVDYDIAEEEEYYVTRPHTSVRRYRQPTQRDTLDDYAPEQEAFIQRRRVSSTVPGDNGITSKAIDPPVSLPRKRRRRSPWSAVIIGMLVMIGLVISFSALSSWWQVHQDDATYGRPRTYQIDAVVGHHDGVNNPSHFIFMNLNRHVIIIEFPGGDPTRALTYTGPTLFGDGGDLIPVTGEFKDVNGDHLPDMLVHVQDQTLVYINDGSKFRPLRPGEHVNL